MGILKLIKVVLLVCMAIGFSGCLSLVTGTAAQAAMISGVEKKYIDKSDADSVLVKVPISKVPTGAMLNVEKQTPKSGAEPTYRIFIDYSSNLEVTMYETLQFKMDEVTTILFAGPPIIQTNLADSFLRGMIWGFQYYPTKDISEVSKIDTTAGKALIDGIIKAKKVTIKNFEQKSDNFLSYTLNPDEVALFGSLK